MNNEQQHQVFIEKLSREASVSVTLFFCGTMNFDRLSGTTWVT